MPAPVSYTHLDVYKRQIIDLCAGIGVLSYAAQLECSDRSRCYADITCVEPVSYTHLDVYKRQGSRPVVGNDYLDAALSTNSFLGYEALGEPAVQEEQAKENG